MNPTLDRILDFLERTRTRATYGAVAKCLAVPAQSMGQELTHKCPRESWIVSSNTGKPKGYGVNECHRELYANREIIRTADELRLKMRLEAKAEGSNQRSPTTV
jgi:hypothetical protein